MGNRYLLTIVVAVLILVATSEAAFAVCEAKPFEKPVLASKVKGLKLAGFGQAVKGCNDDDRGSKPWVRGTTSGNGKIYSDQIYPGGGYTRLAEFYCKGGVLMIQAYLCTCGIANAQGVSYCSKRQLPVRNYIPQNFTPVPKTQKPINPQ